MPAPQTQKTDTPDPNALAGTTNSLGAESKLGGQPATDDNVVEAIDEEGPEIPRSDPQHSDQ